MVHSPIGNIVVIFYNRVKSAVFQPLSRKTGKLRQIILSLFFPSISWIPWNLRKTRFHRGNTICYDEAGLIE